MEVVLVCARLCGDGLLCGGGVLFRPFGAWNNEAGRFRGFTPPAIVVAPLRGSWEKTD